MHRATMSSSPPSDTPLVEHFKSRKSSQSTPVSTPVDKEVASLLEFQSNFHDFDNSLPKKRQSIPRSTVMDLGSDNEDENVRSPVHSRQKVTGKELVDLLQQQSHMKEFKRPSFGKRKSSQHARDIISRAMASEDDEHLYDVDDYAGDGSGEACTPKRPKRGEGGVGRGKQAMGNNKGRYVGHHIIDASLPVYARFYPNGSMVARVYREDVTEETFQRFPNIFLNRQKGLVTVDKILLDKKLFEDYSGEDIQTLSVPEKKKRIRDYLSVLPSSKGRVIGYHIDIPTLPVYAGRYAHDGRVYARVFKDDATKELIQSAPDIFSREHLGQVEFDKIRFDEKLFPDEFDIQSLSIEQKRRRVDEYLASLPNVRSIPEKQVAYVSGSTVKATVPSDAQETVPENAMRSRPQNNMRSRSEKAAQTPSPEESSVKREIHVGYWKECPQLPVYAYLKWYTSNASYGRLCFRCRIEDAETTGITVKELPAGNGGQVRSDAIIFKDGIEKDSAEVTKKHIKSLLTDDNGDVDGEIGMPLSPPLIRDGEDHEQSEEWQSVCETLKKYEEAARRHLANLEAALAEQETIIKARDSTISEQNETVQARGTIIGEQNATIRSLQEEIESLSIQAREKDDLAREKEEQTATIGRLQAEIEALEEPRTKVFGGKQYRLIHDHPNAGIYVFDNHADLVRSSNGQLYREWLAVVEAKRLDVGPTLPSIIMIDQEQYRRVNEEGNNHNGMLVQVGPVTLSQLNGVDVIMTRVRKEVQ